jgi:hypothetical protein
VEAGGNPPQPPNGIKRLTATSTRIAREQKSGTIEVTPLVSGTKQSAGFFDHRHKPSPI